MLHSEKVERFLMHELDFFWGGGIFVDDDGTKDDEQMIVDWAISGYFKPQNSLESVFTRSRCDYTDGQYM